MAQFILLHNYNDNTPLVINMYDINMIYLDSYDNHSNNKFTHIELNDMDEVICVKETPDKIYNTLNTNDDINKARYGPEFFKAKFIKLHEIDTNDVIILNKFNITLIDKEDNETKIYYKCDRYNTFCVNETVEKIFKVLND